MKEKEPHMQTENESKQQKENTEIHDMVDVKLRLRVSTVRDTTK